MDGDKAAIPVAPEDYSGDAVSSLGPIGRENLAERVYGELRKGLLQGRFWPGERLKIRDRRVRAARPEVVTERSGELHQEPAPREQPDRSVILEQRDRVELRVREELLGHASDERIRRYGGVRRDELAERAAVARRALGAREFPDVSATLAALGITRTGGRVTLDEDGRAIRDAIMRPRADLAALPSECGLAHRTQAR